MQVLFCGLQHRWDSRLESTYCPTSVFEGLPSYFDVDTKSEGMKTVSMSRLESTYCPTSVFEGLPSYFDVDTKSEGMKTVSVSYLHELRQFVQST